MVTEVTEIFGGSRKGRNNQVGAQLWFQLQSDCAHLRAKKSLYVQTVSLMKR